MLEIVKSTIEFYLKYLREPGINEIPVTEQSLFEKSGSVFVTLLKNGEIRGSSGNIKEIEPSLVHELIKNTVKALTQDPRFPPVTLNDAQDLKFRVDFIKERRILKDGDVQELDPIKTGVIFIKRDYLKAGVILPNISAKLLSGADFIPFMTDKLGEKSIREKDYIIYSISTEVETNF